MKINEVEALVGITKKNIRFYEEKGLLAPHRNSENGYRDYGDTEIAVLRQIKLLRKLGISLAEIRQMQSGTHTVGDGMRRHLITLERERENLEQAIQICNRLTNCQERLRDLDAGAILDEIAVIEQSGATFQDKQRQDIRVRYYTAPVIITMIIILLMAGLMGFFLWCAIISGENGGTGPLLLMIIISLIPLLVAAGVLWALFQRIREIDGGEELDAKDY